MVSNVSLYPFDPARDEDVAYEPGSRQAAAEPVTGRHPSRELHGQIAFEAPCVSIPDFLLRYKHISLEELEVELERSARRQERSG
jgi:hypothetical protein